MERLVDKAVVLALCSGLMVLSGITTLTIIGMLVAVSLSATFELPSLPRWVQVACPLLYCLLTLFVPAFVVFLPLMAGDLFRLKPVWLRVMWLIPLLAVIAMPDILVTHAQIMSVTCLCLLSCLLCWRGEYITQERKAAYRERDDLAQTSYNLELLNRDLRERQELELRLATLNERSRIAREIHDNVGHLLTRSVLQVKALSVIHADDKQLTSELEQVSETLNTAFESVRTSVHDLHEEAYSLQTQLEALARADDAIEVTVEYRAGEIPSRVAYSFLAIVREALSNAGRHSDATTAYISVIEFPGLYQLTVQDNGSGASLNAKKAEKAGIGLTTMEERARALGGIFRAGYDKGFKVFVSVPKQETE